MRNRLSAEIAAALSKRPPVAAGCSHHHLHRRPFKSAQLPRQHSRRPFHASGRRDVVKPYLLADIGEGITECQVIQWFVQPGARVEQFDKICEVQSDKASVEITSRFDGVIKKLYYEADDMAKVGKPLVDIDIQSDISPEDEKLTKVPSEQAAVEDTPKPQQEDDSRRREEDAAHTRSDSNRASSRADQAQEKHATLATPAVRHLTKELDVDIADVPGTGKDGRVLKEDVHKFASARGNGTQAPQAMPFAAPLGEDRTVPLTPIQTQMFKTMTRALTIPHFLYTDHIDLTSLNAVRKRLNTSSSSSSSDLPQQKVSALPFIVKALSLAMTSFPQLNAHFSAPDSASTSGSSRNGNSDAKPTVTLKASHDIGVAVDTPSGLLVPVVRAVQSHTIASLSAEITRLATVARAGKLSSADLAGATITVSNIGNIGGGAVAPVIVPPQVAIVGVGRARAVPAFDEKGDVVRREECVVSWSADHRVLDGAVVARCAELVRGYLEGLEGMLMKMR